MKRLLISLILTMISVGTALADDFACDLKRYGESDVIKKYVFSEAPAYNDVNDRKFHSPDGIFKFYVSRNNSTFEVWISHSVIGNGIPQLIGSSCDDNSEGDGGVGCLIRREENNNGKTTFSATHGPKIIRDQVFVLDCRVRP